MSATKRVLEEAQAQARERAQKVQKQMELLGLDQETPNS